MERVIQVAGIMDIDEARMLVDMGCHHLGFPLRLPVHREDVSDREAAAIIRSLPPQVAPVLITYLQSAVEILRLCETIGASTVQLHSEIPVDEVGELRAMAPHLHMIKSLVVRGDNFDDLLSSMVVYTPCVDSFITDTYDPSTSACGATGKTHDWEISRRLVEASPHPVTLAGGLTPHNVRSAILTVRPAGVDVHTGIEAPNGRKDRRLAKEFIREAQEAFAILSREARATIGRECRQ